ncbi:MAG TPA: hypothetical protein VIM41_14825 [Gammaproteobacteria bacterium]
MSKIPTDIRRSMGMHISKICPFSIAKNNAENHCAHYVSHIMGYELPGASCKNATWADKQNAAKGATIRVNDLFNSALVTGALANKPAALTECLIFVTLASNIKKVGPKLVMGTHPKKHVGILSQGKVWNYSNSKNIVAADILSLFQTKFTNAYKTSGTTVEFYYGKFL